MADGRAEDVGALIHPCSAFSLSLSLSRQEWRTFIDMEILDLIPKEVRPVEEQDEMESRRLWDPVTQEIMAKNWGEATKQKQVVEQRQRDKAAQRKKTGEE